MKVVEVTKVKIKCPECGEVQDAQVEHGVPFFTYLHWCQNCEYVIMESEFIEV